MAVAFDPVRKRWTVQFEQSKVRVFRRLPPGATRAQADALETKLRREIFDRETLERKPDITIEDAIRLWLQNNARKNQKQAQSEARQWEPWLRGRLLRDAPEVAAEAVREWTRLRAVPATTARSSRVPCATATNARQFVRLPSTINRRLMLLKAVCKWAWRHNHIPDNVSGRIQTLKEPSGRETYLTRQQVMALAQAAPTKTSGCAITIAAYTGLRVSELLALTTASLRNGTLTVSQSKTGKPRIVPVPTSVLPLLRGLPLGLSYWQLRKEFLQARKKAKMPHVKFHDLRHTCASWLINEGVDLFTVGRILGHTSMQTTARYAHLATKTLETAMRKLR